MNRYFKETSWCSRLWTTRAILLTLVVLILLLAIDSSAGFPKNQRHVGTTACPFLKIPVGGRAIGMGGAFIAMDGDIECLYWNPAGLATMNERVVFAQHSEWLVNTDLDYLAWSCPLRVGVMVVDIGHFSAGKVDDIDEEGRNLGSLPAWDALAGVGLAGQIGKIGMYGVHIEYLHGVLGDASGQGVGCDVGILVRFFSREPNVGISIANLGTYSWKSGMPRSLPTVFGVGTRWKLGQDKLIIGLGARFPIDWLVRLETGFEWRVLHWLTLRAGISYLLDARQFGLPILSERYEDGSVGATIKLGRLIVDYVHQGAMDKFVGPGLPQHMDVKWRF